MPDASQYLPRLVIAAPQGRSGKTTVSLGLCAAFRKRGLIVQPFKKGPDYIDPSWLSEASGRACRSLDPFFLDSPEKLVQAFVPPAGRAALSLIEGNHGLFDSFDDAGAGSTAAVARKLRAPILLVINCARLGRSAAAMVLGCQIFEPGTPIAGVVLNNIARGRHEGRIRSAIEAHCNIPVLGALPAADDLAIPDRHLGLIPRAEGDGLLGAIAACQQAAEKYLDLESILKIARTAQSLPVESATSLLPVTHQGQRPRIGVLRDRAFTFYYPENLEALEEAGAELVFIDAFTASALPEVDTVYIGGGFPEVFMEQLSANTGLRHDIRQAAEAGLPIYAECGGMMYLSQRIRWGNRTAQMVGVLPCEIEVVDKPQGHGYVAARIDRENPFFEIGTEIRGHEFHNSRLIKIHENNALNTAYQLERGTGVGDGRDGMTYGNVLAAYTHLHAGAVASWAAALVRRAGLYRASQQETRT